MGVKITLTALHNALENSRPCVDQHLWKMDGWMDLSALRLCVSLGGVVASSRVCQLAFSAAQVQVMKSFFFSIQMSYKTDYW